MKDSLAKSLTDSFKVRLAKDETILWSGYSRDNSRIVPLVLGLLAAYFLIQFMIVDDPEARERLAVVGLLVFCTIGSLAFAVGALLREQNNQVYIVTNKRVGMLGKHLVQGQRFFTYPKIHKCKSYDNDGSVGISVYEGAYSFNITGIKEAELKKAHTIILNHIDKVGMPSIVDKGLLSLATEHELEFLEADGKDELRIVQGKLEEANFRLLIEGQFPIKSIRMSFGDLPNAENNSFRIRKEKNINALKKISIQDFEIGDEETDDEYVLESDYLHFLKTILTTEIQEILKKNSKFKLNAIEFGEYKKAKKKQRVRSKFKADDTVLDAHLIKGDEQANFTKEVQAGLKSKLRISLRNIAAHNGEAFIKELNRIFDLMQLFAKEIRNYNAK